MGHGAVIDSRHWSATVIGKCSTSVTSVQTGFRGCGCCRLPVDEGWFAGAVGMWRRWLWVGPTAGGKRSAAIGGSCSVGTGTRTGAGGESGGGIVVRGVSIVE